MIDFKTEEWVKGRIDRLEKELSEEKKHANWLASKWLGLWIHRHGHRECCVDIFREVHNKHKARTG